VWGEGGAAEESVAEALGKHCPSVFVLSDRRMPGNRGNIDHIAVTANGVWVIDTKNHQGKVEVRTPLFGTAKLLIRGRDWSGLADGLGKQVAAVRAFIDEDVPVHGALCFVRADLPLIGTLKFRGYTLLYRKKLAKRLNADGPLASERVRELAAALAKSFPSA